MVKLKETIIISSDSEKDDFLEPKTAKTAKPTEVAETAAPAETAAAAPPTALPKAPAPTATPPVEAVAPST